MVRNDSTASCSKEGRFGRGVWSAIRLSRRGEANTMSYLLPMSRDSSGDLAQGADKGRGGVRVGQRFQMNRSRELRGLRTKVQLQNILAPGRHQRVQFRRRILLPVRPRGQDDRARLVEIPLPPFALARDPPVVSAPAMPHYFQMEAWRTTQISLESQSFFLPTPATHQPMQRRGSRAELHGDARVFKPPGSEMQSCLQAGTAHPVRLQDASLAGASRLHPA